MKSIEKDELGNRMKTYEQQEAARHLIPLLPIMVRIDGKCFSAFTKDLQRPFDENFHKVMCYTTLNLVREANACVGYTQSDEISLVLQHRCWDSQPFFNGKIQKLTSVLASMATLFFQEGLKQHCPELFMKPAFFDCRVWNVPNETEAVNTLIWREIDATKNSVSMAARFYYSHKKLMNLGRADMQELLFQKGVNWNDYPDEFKRGSYFQRVVHWGRFTTQEIESLPPKHNARQNSDLLVERSEIQYRRFPPLTKILNLTDLFFRGCEEIILKKGPLRNENQQVDPRVEG